MSRLEEGGLADRSIRRRIYFILSGCQLARENPVDCCSSFILERLSDEDVDQNPQRARLDDSKFEISPSKRCGVAFGERAGLFKSRNQGRRQFHLSVSTLQLYTTAKPQFRDRGDGADGRSVVVDFNSTRWKAAGFSYRAQNQGKRAHE